MPKLITGKISPKTKFLTDDGSHSSSRSVVDDIKVLSVSRSGERLQAKPPIQLDEETVLPGAKKAWCTKHHDEYIHCCSGILEIHYFSYTSANSDDKDDVLTLETRTDFVDQV
jgi:hypothetical protein